MVLHFGSFMPEPTGRIAIIMEDLKNAILEQFRKHQLECIMRIRRNRIIARSFSKYIKTIISNRKRDCLRRTFYFRYGHLTNKIRDQPYLAL